MQLFINFAFFQTGFCVQTPMLIQIWVFYREASNCGLRPICSHLICFVVNFLYAKFFLSVEFLVLSKKLKCKKQRLKNGIPLHFNFPQNIPTSLLFIHIFQNQKKIPISRIYRILPSTFKCEVQILDFDNDPNIHISLHSNLLKKILLCML